ncbi:hypothetical protein [Colwellia psychrerythraea]|nr:hypothetical protein [Colwellia psychrerythraea]
MWNILNDVFKGNMIISIHCDEQREAEVNEPKEQEVPGKSEGVV